MNYELEVLNQEFERVAIIDTYKSAIWTDRYCDYGDFELYIPLPTALINDLATDNYLTLENSDRLMIIDTVRTETDVEEGAFLIVTGRSLESILSRRIVQGQVTYSGKTTKEIIMDLLETNFVNPEDSKRAIPNFVIKDFDIPEANEILDDVQYSGEEIYDIVQSLCNAKKLGFKIVLTDTHNFEFSVYAGQNRTYEQQDNPYVVFSPNFENIINSRYTKSTENYKNVIWVAGEGSGTDQKHAEVGNAEGLLRREFYLAASGTSSKTGNGTLTADEYASVLAKKGQESLEEHDIVEEFDGKTEAIEGFTYGVDFYLGDLVQVENEYGQLGSARVTEIIFSQDLAGVEMYPTFKVEAPSNDTDNIEQTGGL